MYTKETKTINHDYIYQSVKAGIISEKIADHLIQQLNKIYNSKGIQTNV